MSSHNDTCSDNLPRSTPRIYNPDHYFEDPIVMPVPVDGFIDEPPMPRPASTQPYGTGCFNNTLNENNQHFDMDDTPFSSPSTLHRLSGAIPSSVNQSIPQTEDFSSMDTMSNISTMPTSTLTPDWGMGSAPFMASMPGMPAIRTTGPQIPITMGPPPVPVATRPNMRKRIPAAATVTSESPSVVDEHHPKPEGAYYPPTKRIKREHTHTHTHTPHKPSWAATSVTDDASVVSLPRPPHEPVNPPPLAGQTTTNPGRKSFPTSFASHSSVPAATQQPPAMQRPASPIIPTPLEPFPEAGTIMNFPLPQIDHQGQRPASGEGYFSALEDDLLYQTQEPYEIEMAYRAALRVRERVDWDCRRLGLRLRYLRRCQARAAELNRVARRCAWQRDDFGEKASSGR